LATEACTSYEVDIITLDLATRLPFAPKFGLVHQAVQRGIFFELTYAPALRSRHPVSMCLCLSTCMCVCACSLGSVCLPACACVHVRMCLCEGA
jgi:hypothetical protein